jgi:hypothetical protein
MQKLLKQNVLTENKFKYRKQKLLKQNALTANKFQSKCRNNLNKMC